MDTDNGLLGIWTTTSCCRELSEPWVNVQVSLSWFYVNILVPSTAQVKLLSHWGRKICVIPQTSPVFPHPKKVEMPSSRLLCKVGREYSQSFKGSILQLLRQKRVFSINTPEWPNFPLSISTHLGWSIAGLQHCWPDEVPGAAGSGLYEKIKKVETMFPTWIHTQQNSYTKTRALGLWLPMATHGAAVSCPALWVSHFSFLVSFTPFSPGCTE